MVEHKKEDKIENLSQQIEALTSVIKTNVELMKSSNLMMGNVTGDVVDRKTGKKKITARKRKLKKPLVESITDLNTSVEELSEEESGTSDIQESLYDVDAEISALREDNLANTGLLSKTYNVLSTVGKGTAGAALGVGEFTASSMTMPSVFDAKADLEQLKDSIVKSMSLAMGGPIGSYVLNLSGNILQSVIGGIRKATGVGAEQNIGDYPTEEMPEFATGGVVPGPPGAPVIIKAHGGEMVVPEKIKTRGMEGFNDRLDALIKYDQADLINNDNTLKELVHIADILNFGNSIFRELTGPIIGSLNTVKEGVVDLAHNSKEYNNSIAGFLISLPKFIVKDVFIKALGNDILWELIAKNIISKVFLRGVVWDQIMLPAMEHFMGKNAGFGQITAMMAGGAGMLFGLQKLVGNKSITSILGNIMPDFISNGIGAISRTAGNIIPGHFISGTAKTISGAAKTPGLIGQGIAGAGNVVSQGGNLATSAGLSGIGSSATGAGGMLQGVGGSLAANPALILGGAFAGKVMYDYWQAKRDIPFQTLMEIRQIRKNTEETAQLLGGKGFGAMDFRTKLGHFMEDQYAYMYDPLKTIYKYSGAKMLTKGLLEHVSRSSKDLGNFAGRKWGRSEAGKTKGWHPLQATGRALKSGGKYFTGSWGENKTKTAKERGSLEYQQVDYLAKIYSVLSGNISENLEVIKHDSKSISKYSKATARATIKEYRETSLLRRMGLLENMFSIPMAAGKAIGEAAVSTTASVAGGVAAGAGAGKALKSVTRRVPSGTAKALRPAASKISSGAAKALRPAASKIPLIGGALGAAAHKIPAIGGMLRATAGKVPYVAAALAVFDAIKSSADANEIFDKTATNMREKISAGLAGLVQGATLGLSSVFISKKDMAEGISTNVEKMSNMGGIFDIGGAYARAGGGSGNIWEDYYGTDNFYWEQRKPVGEIVDKSKLKPSIYTGPEATGYKVNREIDGGLFYSDYIIYDDEGKNPRKITTAQYEKMLKDGDLLKTPNGDVYTKKKDVKWVHVDLNNPKSSLVPLDIWEKYYSPEVRKGIVKPSQAKEYDKDYQFEPGQVPPEMLEPSQAKEYGRDYLFEPGQVPPEMLEPSFKEQATQKSKMLLKQGKELVSNTVEKSKELYSKTKENFTSLKNKVENSNKSDIALLLAETEWKAINDLESLVNVSIKGLDSAGFSNSALAIKARCTQLITNARTDFQKRFGNVHYDENNRVISIEKIPEDLDKLIKDDQNLSDYIRELYNQVTQAVTNTKDDYLSTLKEKTSELITKGTDKVKEGAKYLDKKIGSVIAPTTSKGYSEPFGPQPVSEMPKLTPEPFGPQPVEETPKTISKGYSEPFGPQPVVEPPRPTVSVVPRQNLEKPGIKLSSLDEMFIKQCMEDITGESWTKEKSEQLMKNVENLIQKTKENSKDKKLTHWGGTIELNEEKKENVLSDIINFPTKDNMLSQNIRTSPEIGLEFDEGGYVPGKKGEAQPAIVHTGERILNPKETNIFKNTTLEDLILSYVDKLNPLKIIKHQLDIGDEVTGLGNTYSRSLISSIPFIGKLIKQFMPKEINLIGGPNNAVASELSKITPSSLPTDYSKVISDKTQSVKEKLETKTIASLSGLGGSTAQYEGGNVGTVSSGKHDYVSYGTHQMTPTTMKGFLGSSFGSQFDKQLGGLKPGSAEFTSAYKQLAKTSPELLDNAMNEYLKVTNFEPVRALADKYGLPNDPVFNDILWSQSIQHSYKGNKQILDTVAAQSGGYLGDDEKKQLISSIYDTREKYALKFVDPNLKKGIVNRYNNEENQFLAMAEKPAFDKTSLANIDINRRVQDKEDLLNIMEESGKRADELAAKTSKETNEKMDANLEKMNATSNIFNNNNFNIQSQGGNSYLNSGTNKGGNEIESLKDIFALASGLPGII